MKKPGILFDYLAVLAVIQPARIQDIESYAPQTLPNERTEKDVKDGLFRIAHEVARERGYVVPVRRGTYFLTPKGREMVRTSDLHKEIDNLRLFLMKDQRKKYR